MYNRRSVCLFPIQFNLLVSWAQRCQQKAATLACAGRRLAYMLVIIMFYVISISCHKTNFTRYNKNLLKNPTISNLKPPNVKKITNIKHKLFHVKQVLK